VFWRVLTGCGGNAFYEEKLNLGMTLVEKILARSSGNSEVSPGEAILLKPDIIASFFSIILPLPALNHIL